MDLDDSTPGFPGDPASGSLGWKPGVGFPILPIRVVRVDQWRGSALGSGFQLPDFGNLLPPSLGHPKLA